MNMSNNCNCNYVPCQCHTTCVTPVVCVPSPPSNKPKPPTISVEGLLKLIAAKCDNTMCEIIQEEVALLYTMLGLDGSKPTPGQPLPGVAFQLITNMVESLAGDLKDKYPSANLLKAQLKALWECVYTKQQHHGEWKNNYTVRGLVASDDLCALDGEDAPTSFHVITPVDVGSTVFHTINGRRCLFESLIDNNVEAPSKLGVLEGKWINYCDIVDTINCVLPRKKLTDCKLACDDPDNDGVIEEKTMCERMLAVEAYMKAHP